MATPPQQTDIRPLGLTLTSPEKYEVANSTHFRQHLQYGGHKMQLLIQNLQLDGLSRKQNDHGLSFRIPIDAWLRKQLDIVEEFAKQRVDVSVFPEPNTSNAREVGYKPLWSGAMMYISASPWCNYLQLDAETGQTLTLNHTSTFGRGSYDVSLEIPYIYIGAHKGGQIYSLSLSLVQIVYKPTSQAPPPVPSQAPPAPSQAPPPAPTPIKFKLPEKRGRPRKEIQNVAKTSIANVKTAA